MWISNLIGKEFSCHENSWGFDSLLIRWKVAALMKNKKHLTKKKLWGAFFLNK